MSEDQFDGSPDDDYLDNDYPDDGTAALVDEDSPLQSLEVLASRVRRLVELRDEKDMTETAAKTAKAEYENYMAEFFEEYERSPLKGSIKVDLGGDLGVIQLTPRSTSYGRVLNYDDAVRYFEENGQLDDYVKKEIRKARINEIVKECREQRKPLPPGLDFYTKEYFTITRR